MKNSSTPRQHSRIPFDALEHSQGEHPEQDQQTALHACAFLLRFATEGSNEPADGHLCEGIARAIEHIAADIHRGVRRRGLSSAAQPITVAPAGKPRAAHRPRK